MQQKTWKSPFKVDNLVGAAIPLALVGCGGGAGGSTVVSGISGGGSGIAVPGTAVKGPLSNATAFIDLDGDGLRDSNEPQATTEVDGSFTIRNVPAGTTASIVVVTNADTVDASTQAPLDGVTLTAPSGASVVSPLTTLVDKGGLSAESIATKLGLPAGVDPLTYNPFASGVNASEALAVEKAAHQVLATIRTLAEIGEGVGVSSFASLSASAEAIANTLSAATSTVDLSNTSAINSIFTQAASAFNLSGNAKTAFDATATSAKAALENVNSQIASVSSLTSESAKAAFKLGATLADQVKSGVETAVAGGDPASQISFKDADAVSSAARTASEASDVTGSVFAGGPLEGMLVFVDKNGDGIRQETEEFARTDANGTFTISTRVINPSLVAEADGSTVDTIGGNTSPLHYYTNTGSSTVISPFSMLMERFDLTSAELAAAIGFSEGVADTLGDLSEFNPWADGALSAGAELTAVQVMYQIDAIFQMIGAVAIGSSTMEIEGEVVASVLGSLEAALAEGVSIRENASVFAQNVFDEFLATEVEIAGRLDNAGITTQISNTIAAVVDDLGRLSLNQAGTAISTVENLGPDGTDGYISNVEVVVNGIFSLTQNAFDPNEGSPVALDDLDTGGELEVLKLFAPPSELGFLVGGDIATTTTYTEGFAGPILLDVAGSDGWVLQILEIEGTDFSEFSIGESGDELLFDSPPDYEDPGRDNPQAYSLALKAVDLTSGKSFSDTLLIRIDDVPDV